jgi:hypothetical protein
VQHLVQLMKPSLDAILTAKEAPVLADLGAGKSYSRLFCTIWFLGRRGAARSMPSRRGRS